MHRKRKFLIYLSIFLSAFLSLPACGSGGEEVAATGELTTSTIRTLDSESFVNPIAAASIASKSAIDTRTFLEADQAAKQAAAEAAQRAAEEARKRAEVSNTYQAASVSAEGTTGFVNGYPCGGRLPPCWVLRRESKGNPTAVNRTGCGGRTCGGLWQFDPVTWIPGCTVSEWNAGGCGTYQGFRFAQDAPPDIQNQRAEEIYDGGAGGFHWGA